MTKSRKPPKVEDFVSSLKSQVSSLGLESRSGVSVGVGLGTNVDVDGF